MTINPKKVREAVWSILGAVAAISLLFWIFGGSTVAAGIFGIEVGYMVMSFGYVKNNQAAARFLLGAPDDKVPPGPYLALWGIEQVRRVPSVRKSDELPGNPEQIFMGDDKDPIPEGLKYRVIRMKFGGPAGDDSQELKDDPYNKPMVINVTPVVVWKVPQDMAIKFFENYASVREFREIVADKAVGICGTLFATMSPAKASRQLEDIKRRLTEQISRELDHTGPDILEVYLKPFGFSKTLNEAVIDLAVAEQTSQKNVRLARAEGEALTLKGEGAANARRSMIKAEGDGAERLAKLANTEGGRFALVIGAANRAFENAGTIVTGGGDVLTGILGSLGTALKGGKKS